MFKHFAAIAALAVLLAATSTIGRAEAGASASAPSKNLRASHQVAAQQAQSGHKTARNDFGITEYSSSSPSSWARGR
jgi:hypothetical protein